MGKGERSRVETQAHHVSISPQEDRGGTAGKVGEGDGAAEAEVAAQSRTGGSGSPFETKTEITNPEPQGIPT